MENDISRLPVNRILFPVFFDILLIEFFNGVMETVKNQIILTGPVIGYAVEDIGILTMQYFRFIGKF
jgi:hypothetical protein